MSNEKSGPAYWAGRKIHDKALIPILDQEAAIYEFKHGMSRQDSEEKTHQNYIRNTLLDLAAHHRKGMQVAHSAHAWDELDKHRKAFEETAKMLGIDPTKELPKEIVDRMHQPLKIYKYRAHEAEKTFLPKEEKGGGT